MKNFKITKVLSVPKTSEGIIFSTQDECCCDALNNNECNKIEDCIDCLFYEPNEEHFNKYIADKIESQKGK